MDKRMCVVCPVIMAGLVGTLILIVRRLGRLGERIEAIDRGLPVAPAT